jgi:DNA polymerase III psi subunit
MDLNKIILSPFTVAELYRSSLVLPEEDTTERPAPTVSKTAKPKWLGNNRRNILIVVSHTKAVHMPDNELELLTGILTACKLSLEDVAIINKNNFLELGYKELTTQFSSKMVFLFGIEPAAFGLPMNFPHFQSQAFMQVNYLSAPTLQEIADDRTVKTNLWQCLKKIFQI